MTNPILEEELTQKLAAHALWTKNKDNPDGKLLDLSHRTISNQDLSRANFVQATLIGTHFENVELVGCDFSKSEIHGAKFINCNLTSADFVNIHATSTDFSGSNFTGASCFNSYFKECIFHRIKAKESDWHNSIVCANEFRGANLERAIMSGGDYSDSSFLFCNLSECNFLKANFRFTRFDGSYLHETRF